MATPEGKVKTWALRKLQEEFPDSWGFSPRGGAFGKAGTPDRIICVGGLFVAIEFKADDQGVVTDLQRAQLLAIKNAGGIAAVLKGKDERKLQLIIATIRSKLQCK